MATAKTAYFTIGWKATGSGGTFAFRHGGVKNDKGESKATLLEFENGKHTPVSDPEHVRACRRHVVGGYLQETDGKGQAPEPQSPNTASAEEN